MQVQNNDLQTLLNYRLNQWCPIHCPRVTSCPRQLAIGIANSVVNLLLVTASSFFFYSGFKEIEILISSPALSRIQLTSAIDFNTLA
jgi:hypothetical protein